MCRALSYALHKAVMMKSGNKHKIRNDIILAVVLVLISLLAIFIITSLQTTGEYAVVTVDGKHIARYPLNKDTEITIHSGGDDEHINVLVINNGKASVRDADCPDRICVSHKAISKVGETIVCLPHKLVISIEAEKAQNLDAVT